MVCSIFVVFNFTLYPISTCSSMSRIRLLYGTSRACIAKLFVKKKIKLICYSIVIQPFILFCKSSSVFYSSYEGFLYITNIHCHMMPSLLLPVLHVVKKLSMQNLFLQNILPVSWFENVYLSASCIFLGSLLFFKTS